MVLTGILRKVRVVWKTPRETGMSGREPQEAENGDEKFPSD